MSLYQLQKFLFELNRDETLEFQAEFDRQLSVLTP